MSKIFTKLSSLALAAAVVGSGFSGSANAAELESQVPFNNAVFYETQENVGVSEVIPGVVKKGEIVTYGTSKPTSEWNLSSKGRYNFSGSSNSVNLYTDYLFTGKTSFKISISNNDHQYSLKFKVKRKDLVFDNQIGDTYEVPLNKSGSVTVSSLDKSAKYYIEFIGPNKFSGYIE